VLEGGEVHNVPGKGLQKAPTCRGHEQAIAVSILLNLGAITKL
jgi:hypothetical protein